MYTISQLPVSIGAELSASTAYFLGGILSSMDFHKDADSEICLSTVRHNSGMASPEELEEHLSSLKKIAIATTGVYFSKQKLVEKRWFASNKLGFGFVFRSDNDVNIPDFLRVSEALLKFADGDILRAFLVGAFDGRASFDIDRKNGKIRYLALDCPEISAPIIIMVLDRFGIEHNFNTARERINGGLPRKPQLRIPSNQIPLFMQEAGFISPARLRSVETSSSIPPHTLVNSSLLTGLVIFHIDGTPLKSKVVVPLEPIQVETEHIYDEELARKIADRDLTKKNALKYSGNPKEKSSPIETRGRKIFSRDPKVSANALAMADYKCESDPSHITFIRKLDGLPYTEPHHLVPMGFSSIFDVSLDIEENIISLCSTCHNQLHYGKDIHQILEKIYNMRKDLLRNVGIEISFDELLAMYK